MSGPLEEVSEVTPGLGVSAIEVREGRSVNIGRMGVLRVLPTKGRRTVGPWCFVDLMRPGDIAEPPPLEIGPHPHIGLATATWLFRGTLEVPLAPRFEHGVVPIDEPVKAAEAIVEPGSLALVPAGYQRLRIEERAGAARLLLLGGEPLGVEIKVRIEAPTPPWVRNAS